MRKHDSAKRRKQGDMRIPLATIALVLSSACVTASPIQKYEGSPVEDELQSEHAPTKGPADALVVIQEFSNFTCPFCARAKDTMSEIEKGWPDEVRFVSRQSPLARQTNSELASRAALAAHRQGAFWRYSEILYLNPRALSEEDLVEYAARLGLDTERLLADMDGDLVAEWMETDRRVAEENGIRGTPIFLVNGHIIRGAQPFELFEAVIDLELARAQELRRYGMPKENVAAWLTTNNLREARFEAEMAAEEARREAAAAPRPDPRPAPPPVFAAVPYDAGSPWRGAAEDEALVTLIVFNNYECIFCARLEKTLDALLERWPETLRIVYRHRTYPDRPNSLLAAEAAYEAFAQGRLVPFQRMMGENPRELDLDSLLRYGAEAGLDVYRLRTALEEGRHRPLVDEDNRVGEQFNVRGTPISYINGHMVLGAQPIGVFEEMIAAEMEQAERVARDTGLSGRALYERIIELGSDEQD